MEERIVTKDTQRLEIPIDNHVGDNHLRISLIKDADDDSAVKDIQIWVQNTDGEKNTVPEKYVLEKEPLDLTNASISVYCNGTLFQTFEIPRDEEEKGEDEETDAEGEESDGEETDTEDKCEEGLSSKT